MQAMSRRIAPKWAHKWAYFGRKKTKKVMKKTEKDGKRIKKSYRQEVSDFINDIRSKMEQNGEFDRTITAQLDILAINMQMYLDAYDQVKKDGLFIRNDRDNVQKHPAVDVMSKAFSQIAALSKAYGLTPLDRKRLDAGISADAEESPLEKWIAHAEN